MKTEVFEVMKTRRAIRKFKPEQITEEELNAVLECGTYAPTSRGLQSPVIIVVQEAEQRARLEALNAVYSASQSHPYYNAPTILLILYTDAAPSEENGILDCGAVCTNMLNAATAAGLGACWIHRCKPMFESAEGKALLKEWGLPENLRGVASIALGYIDGDIPVPKERKADYIVRV